jgi:threonine dehydrogenase-like Zn-dependent dehydrogenase
LKAYVVNKPFEHGLKNVPMPVCNYDGVVVKVLAVALCHSDLDVLEGRRKHQVKFPNTIGHEFTGEVVEKGGGVNHVNVGDHVVCECIIWCGTCKFCRLGMTSLCDNFSELGTMESGAFAEYVAIPGRLTHIASGLSIEQAALIEPAGNGCHAAEQAGILPGDNVVIIGPGPIGILAMQFAATYNPEKLIMIGTRDSRLERARQFGATHTINIRNTDSIETMIKLTNGKGADRIINCATTDSSFETAMKIAGKNAIIVMEGLSGSDKAIPILMDDFIVKTFSVVPACGVHTRQYMKTMALVRDGKINVTDLITHRFTLDEMDKVLQTAKENDSVMKIVVYPNRV